MRLIYEENKLSGLAQASRRGGFFRILSTLRVKRISEKAVNMEALWKNAREMQEGSGCQGVRYEDNEASIDKVS